MAQTPLLVGTGSVAPAELALAGDMAALEQASSEMIKLQPTGAEAYAMRALSFMARKQFTEAEQDARKTIQLAPQAPDGYLAMGNLRALQKNFPDAENWYKQSLSRDPNSSDALRGLMNIHIFQKQPDKAIAAARAQIAISPNNSVFYDLLGTALLTKKDFGAAETALKKAVELNKSNADAYLRLGQAQVGKGALDDAISTYKAGIAANPKVAALYLVMGSVYEGKHDYDQAKSAYQTALQLKPNDPLASNNLAYVLLERGGNADLALQLAQTARRGLPTNSNVADTLGWAFYQKGVYRSAVDMFQEAIKLAAKNKEPESPTYHYHLAMAYEKTAQPTLARQHFERVLKLDPKYSAADDVRKQLAQLKS